MELRSRQARPGLAEAIVVWGLLGLDGAAVYRLYAGSLDAPGLVRRRTGREAGIDQLLMLGRHPGLPMAVAILPIAVSRLAHRDRWPVVLGSAAVGGVASAGMACLRVDGARPSRGDVLAGAGMVAALGATIGSAWKAGIGPVRGAMDRDAARAMVAAGLIANGLPWFLADLGIHAGDLRGLGKIVLSRQFLPEGATWPAVHLGHHHGLDGTLLALAAVVLSRSLPEVGPDTLREALSFYLAFLLVYGAMRAVQDGWDEQVVKRGWSRRRIPSIVRRRRPVRPRLWVGMLGCAAAIHAVWFVRR